MPGIPRHGHATTAGKSLTYQSWLSMRDRCFNPRNPRFLHYGGKGVTVNPRWDTFENFLADMGDRPAGTTLGRFRDQGNYEPGNCAWQNSQEQAKKGSSNGRARLHEEQVLCARALYTPKARRGCSIKNMAADLGVSFGTMDLAVRGVTWRSV